MDAPDRATTKPVQSHGRKIDATLPMTSKASQAGSGGLLGRVRVAALITVLVGGAGSVAAVVIASQGRDLGALVVLIFSIWVFAPFAGLVFADRLAKRWSVTTRTTPHRLMLVLALGSLTIYVVDTVRNAGGLDAFVFVVVPLVSWVLIVMVLVIAAFFGRRATPA